MFKSPHKWPGAETDRSCLRTREGITYLLQLPAAPSVRLVQQPCADDWVHVDSYALDAGQQDCSWKAKKIKAMINLPKKKKNY